MMGVEVQTNLQQIKARIKKGMSAMIPVLTEAVIEYGNVYVRKDQGTLEDLSLIHI